MGMDGETSFLVREGQTDELVVKGCGLSSHRLLIMSLRGSYLHFCLWMLLGATLALGQGQGKETMPPLPAGGTLL